MNEWKKFITTSGLYFLGNILPKSFSFLLLPIYTKYLNPSDYGYYDVVIAYLSIITSVLFLDIWNAVLRFMFQNRGDAKYNPVYSGGVIFLASILVYSIVLLSIQYFIEIKYFVLVFINGLSLTIQSYYSSVARGLRRNKVFAFSGIISTLIAAISNLIMIVFMGMDYSALYLSSIISIAVQLLILELSVKLIKNYSADRIDSALMKQIFLFAAPLCLNSLSFWLLSSYNRVAVASYLNVYENGLFSIASKFSAILVMASMCFSMAWQETAFSKNGTSEEKGVFFSNALNLYIKFILISTLIILPTIWVIFPYFIDSNYGKAKSYIPLYLIGTMMSILSNFLGTIFGNIMKPKIVLISTLMGSVVSIASMHGLITVFGVNGANLSFILGFTVTVVTRVILLNKFITLKLNYRLVFLGTISVVCWVYLYHILNFTLAMLLILISFVLGLLVFKNEINRLLNRNWSD